MIFSSLEFLCIFLPIVFLAYCLIPKLGAKNCFLTIASLCFYAYGEPVYVVLIIISAVINYIAALQLEGRPAFRKGMLALVVVLNLGNLAVFKYAAFAVQIWNDCFSTKIPIPNLELPIGISFFTFQALSYVIDVYRGKIKAQKNFVHVLLYLSFFPQLIAGPIVKYRDIDAAMNDRHQNVQQIADGLQRFIFGLGKKIIIANTVGRVVDCIFAAEAGKLNIVTAWMGAILYMLQIYYDFSGYSDMAIGLGKMFGFQFQENFCYPYGADSVREFWHRWHISLSSWFKEYLYIPLGGNRKGKVRTCVNKIIVFFFTGLWHGANWTFIIWGLWHGMFLLLEEYLPFLKKMPRIFKHVYTLLVVCLGFVIFRADTITQGVLFIRQMFTTTGFSPESISFTWQQMTPWVITVTLVGIIGSAPLRPLMERLQKVLEVRTDKTSNGCEIIRTGIHILSVLLLVWCLMRLSANTYNPFIYFRF